MAITDPRKLSDFSGFLTPEQSAPIFEKAAQTSVVQRLAQKVPLGISGKAIPVFTGEVTAGWVDEGGSKHVTEGGMTLKNMVPKKLTAIHVASMEVVRANPGGYITTMENKVAEAFAISFDLAALFDTTQAGGDGPFTVAVNDTDKSPVTLGTAAANTGGVYKDIVNGLEDLVDDDKELTGFALSPRAEPALLGAVDTAGHPIFVNLPPVDTSPVLQSRLIGRPAAVSKGVHGDGETLIIGGDWSQAAWGVVGGISYRTSTEGTVTIDGELVSLFENNLVAVLMEAEYGFVLADEDAFVLYQASGS